MVSENIWKEFGDFTSTPEFARTKWGNCDDTNFFPASYKADYNHLEDIIMI